MARHSRRHRSRSRGRGRSRSLAGGSGSYSSATTYGEYVNGSAGSQYNRVFDQAGAYGQIPGNVIIGAQGQNVDPASQVPTQQNLDLIQRAGKRRSYGRRHRKGGFLGEVVNQAIVPFALLGMQNTYRRKRGGSRRTRRHHRR
jgi:hypothetical protein